MWQYFSRGRLQCRLLDRSWSSYMGFIRYYNMTQQMIASRRTWVTNIYGQKARSQHRKDTKVTYLDSYHFLDAVPAHDRALLHWSSPSNVLLNHHCILKDTGHSVSLQDANMKPLSCMLPRLWFESPLSPADESLKVLQI